MTPLRRQDRGLSIREATLTGESPARNPRIGRERVERALVDCVMDVIWALGDLIMNQVSGSAYCGIPFSVRGLKVL